MSILKNSYFSDGLCIDESKVSVLIVGFIINTLLISFLCLKALTTDVSQVPFEILQNIHFALIVAIGGVNLSGILKKGK